MKKNKKLTIGLSVLSVTIWAMMSCNSEYPNLLNTDYGDDTAGKTVTEQKVLYVLVDGLNGDVLKEIMPPNISEISNSSVYTFEGLTDIDVYDSNLATGWATLLTGLNPGHHGVIGPAQPNLGNIPTIFGILNNKQTSLYTSSADLSELVKGQPDQTSLVASDADVHAAAIQGLGSDLSDLYVVNFSGVDQAGSAGGYTTDNTNYVEQINTIDGYIRDMSDAIKARPDYSKENWLIVVTSNRGDTYGTAPSQNNYFLVPEKNNFMVFYNSKMSSRYYSRPGTEIPFVSTIAKFNLTLSGKGKAELPSSEEFRFYMPNVGDGYTVEMKVKFSGNGTSSSWAEIISKTGNRDDSGNGWVINTPSGQGMYQVRVGSARITAAATDGTLFGDGMWHTLTLTFRRTAASSILFTRYLDGKSYTSATSTISSATLGDNTYKLTVGLKSTSSVSGTPLLSVSNLTIYNVPFTDTDVANNYCGTDVVDTHPYYSNLIGFWAFNEGTGNTVPNKVDPTNTDQAFVFSGSTTWENVNEYSQYLCPAVTDAYYRVVPLSADAPLTILQWLGVSLHGYENLDGRTWPFTYKNLSAE